jgi:hypothetical protein
VLGRIGERNTPSDDAFSDQSTSAGGSIETIAHTGTSSDLERTFCDDGLDHTRAYALSFGMEGRITWG